MKKTVIVLLSIILVLAIVLIYKFISRTNEDIDVASINTNEEISSDLYSGYRDNFVEEVKANLIVTYKNRNQIRKNNDDEEINQDNKIEMNTQKSNNQNYSSYNNNSQQSINNSNSKVEKQETTQSKTENNKTTVVKEEEKEEEKLEYVVQLTTKIENKFKGYENNNIYVLENGGAFIQTDWTSETKRLSNPEVELRYYVGEKQFKLYVDGMKSDVQVASLYARKGNTVFPQLEYSKYNAKVESFISTGTLNSSMSKPYIDKLDDIKNNWTKLGQGRVICVSNTSYWEQIDNSTGTFKENAEVIVGTYNGNSYMVIEGIDDPILVRQYEI